MILAVFHGINVMTKVRFLPEVVTYTGKQGYHRQSSGSGKIKGTLIVQNYMLEVQHTTFLYPWGGKSPKIG